MSTDTRRIEGFRQRKDQFFKDHENSPLTAEQKTTFEHWVKVGGYDGHLTNSDAYADDALEGVVYRGR